MDIDEEPQTLYWAYAGRLLCKRLLYVGVTNSRSRRLREHGALSEWMPEATTIKLKNYRSRKSVLKAERRTIRAKRPLYNVQHNRGPREINVSGDDIAAGLAGIGAAACVAVLTTRWAADELSTRWIARRARQQGVAIELPPPGNPFSEPSVTLSMLWAFLSVASGDKAVNSPHAFAAMPEVDLKEPSQLEPASTAGTVRVTA